MIPPVSRLPRARGSISRGSTALMLPVLFLLLVSPCVSADDVGRAYVYFGGSVIDAQPDLVLIDQASGDPFGQSGTIPVAGVVRVALLPYRRPPRLFPTEAP